MLNQENRNRLNGIFSIIFIRDRDVTGIRDRVLFKREQASRRGENSEIEPSRDCLCKGKWCRSPPWRFTHFGSFTRSHAATHAPFKDVLTLKASATAGKPCTNIDTCAEWTNCDTLGTGVRCEDFGAQKRTEVPGAANEDACGMRSMVKKALVEGETYYAIVELWL